jgi:serine/threonine protein kinase
MGRKHKHEAMICARCGEATNTDPCAHCGESPVLEGRYLLQDVLGAGAEGTTYRAREIEGGRIVAVKEMPLRRARDDKARELLRREAEILRQLHHDAIPRHLDDFTVGVGKNSALYLVQEYIDGRSLDDEEGDHRYDVSEVLAILEEILDVLAYLHGLSPPVIHRDVKPSNVMRRSDGRLVLIDFGSVRDVLADAALGGETVTGTFGYMAPEQLVGDASEASDLYGLGALALNLLSRREPHTLLRYDRTLDWEPYVQAPKAVMKLLHSLLQPDPARRASDAIEVRETVRRIRWKCASELDEAEPDASSPTTEDDAQDTERTFTPAGLALIVWLGITLLAFIGYPLLMNRDSEPDDSPAPEVAAVEPRALAAAPASNVISTESPADEGIDRHFEVGTGSYPPRSGEVDADVTIVVFADFACADSQRLSRSLTQLDFDFGDRVALYFRDYPQDIHPTAYGAHEAARCAHAHGQFWPLHTTLFARQAQLERHHLEHYGLKAGLDYHAFLACLASGETRLDIEIDRKAGRELGVEVTPTFFIDGTRYVGVHSNGTIREIIELALAQAAAADALDALEEARLTP